MAKDDLDFSGGLGDYRTRLGQAYKDAENRNKGTGFLGRLGEAFLTRAVIDPLATSAAQSVTSMLNMPRERRLAKHLESADRLAEKRSAKLVKTKQSEIDLFDEGYKKSNLTPLQYQMKLDEGSALQTFYDNKFNNADTLEAFQPTLVNKDFILNQTFEARQKNAEAKLAQRNKFREMISGGVLSNEQLIENQRQLAEELEAGFLTKQFRKITPKDEEKAILEKFKSNPALMNNLLISDAIEKAEQSGNLNHVAVVVSKMDATKIPKEMRGNLKSVEGKFDVVEGIAYETQIMTYQKGSTVEKVPFRKRVTLGSVKGKEGAALINLKKPTIDSVIKGSNFSPEIASQLRSILAEDIFGDDPNGVNRLFSNEGITETQYSQAMQQTIAYQGNTANYGDPIAAMQAKVNVERTKIILQNGILSEQHLIYTQEPPKSDEVAHAKWEESAKQADKVIAKVMEFYDKEQKNSIGLTKGLVSLAIDKNKNIKTVPKNAAFKIETDPDTGRQVEVLYFLDADNISSEIKAAREKNYANFIKGNFSDDSNIRMFQANNPVKVEDNKKENSERIPKNTGGIIKAPSLMARQ